MALSFYQWGGDESTAKNKMGEKLFVDLPVNKVAKVILADSESQVTLVKGDTVWQLEERNGYPADFDGLRDLVIKLSRLKIGRSFTATEESITRLSLAPPTASDTSGKGKQIWLMDASEKTLTNIILGEIRKTESGSGGQYLKKADEEIVFLVDGSFPLLKTSPPQWLNKEVLKLNAEEIESVVCYPGKDKNPLYTLSRQSKGETARLNPVPKGRTANTSKIEQVFDALNPLTLDDVQQDDQVSQADELNQIRIVYTLYNGTQINIFPETDGQEPFTLRLTAEQVPQNSEKPSEETSVAENGETDTKEKAEDKSIAEPPAAIKSAQQINEELGGWVFSVKKWQFDSFITKMELLLEEIKKDEG